MRGKLVFVLSPLLLFLAASAPSLAAHEPSTHVEYVLGVGSGEDAWVCMASAHELTGGRAPPLVVAGGCGLSIPRTGLLTVHIEDETGEPVDFRYDTCTGDGDDCLVHFGTGGVVDAEVPDTHVQVRVFLGVGATRGTIDTA